MISPHGMGASNIQCTASKVWVLGCTTIDDR
jgi:hypothetical protein